MLHAILADNYSFWLPELASKNGPEYDYLFYFILAINIVFSSLIMAMMIYFVLKYRHRKGCKHDPTAGHSTALELNWTIIPTLIVLVIFYYGFRGYLHANTNPPYADQVTANGSMWKWTFTYPNGLTHEELHLVVDRPTDMVLQSTDVLHDLDIPAFRMKKDVVPGRYNREWFEPNKVGHYQVYCAMYCGTGHSVMLADCYVQTQADFDAWMQKQLVWEDAVSFIDRGKYLYSHTGGCNSCHTVDGIKNTGPTWKDLYGSMVPLTDGHSVLADDDYIVESIVAPSKKIVAGFEDKMPQDFGSRLKPNDIKALTWYIKSLSSLYKGDLSEGNRVGAALNGGKGPTTKPATVPATPEAPK